MNATEWAEILRAGGWPDFVLTGMAAFVAEHKAGAFDVLYPGITRVFKAGAAHPRAAEALTKARRVFNAEEEYPPCSERESEGRRIAKRVGWCAGEISEVEERQLFALIDAVDELDRREDKSGAAYRAAVGAVDDWLDCNGIPRDIVHKKGAKWRQIVVADE